MVPSASFDWQRERVVAGLMYGRDAVPERWVSQLARRDEVLALYERFTDSCAAHWRAKAE
jgi:hypothetical protein